MNIRIGPIVSRFIAAFSGVLLLTSCGVLGEFIYPSWHSDNLSKEPTSFSGSSQKHSRPNVSEVVPLPDGDAALDIWLAAIDSADETIDIQTFIFRPDPTGRLIAQRLVEAANRGVVVRILVDDLFHYWKGHNLGFLANQKGITVKVFNPLDRAVPPPFDYLLEYDLVDARMHGKALIIDGDTAIIGGRNVGAEYFRQDENDYFLDFEVFLRGAASVEILAAFNLFWNDTLARDYVDFAPGSGRARRIAFGEVAPQLSEAQQGLETLLSRHNVFRTDALLYIDSPDKLRSKQMPGSSISRDGALSALTEARESVLIVTPYFLPGEKVTDTLIGLAQSGVRLRVVTNSIGSTNHPSVHAGYLKHRKRLLRAGAEIFEFRPGIVFRRQTEERSFAPLTTLHSKIMLVDGEITITGSMNLDARSLDKNSELLVELISPSLHQSIDSWAEKTLLRSSYRLALAADDTITWEIEGPKGPVVRSTEPSHDLGSSTVLLFFALTGLDTVL